MSDSTLTNVGLPTPPGWERRGPATMPLQVGRYVITKPIGQGGMAMVYAAWDPELDRRVAIKVLRAGVSGRRFTVGQARLQREAQTLAKLSHPHVVHVYEVGWFGESVFIAMELIQGETLRAWLAREVRSWQEVVRVFRAAGEGLAAAHAVGIIHRDFKPDNVLVGDDGRVRVVDFGLARLEEPGDDVFRTPAGPEGVGLPLHTAAGGMLGTPAYMAPEQHRGELLDGRTDQFAFCVSLFEGLYRERPFAGRSYPELQAAVLAGRVPEIRGAKVPTWLRRVVLKGMNVLPHLRYADMSPLLAALARDPAVRRRRIAGAIGLAAALGGGAAVSNQVRTQPHGPCVDVAAQLTDVWDARRKADIELAMRATGVAFAPASWTAVERGLDAYAQAWSTQAQEACAATQVRVETSLDLLDLRQACLRGRLIELRALSDVLVRPDRQAVEKAAAAVDALPSLAPCADETYLRARVKPPTDPPTAHAVAAVREQLAQARARQAAGDMAAAARLSEAAAAAAAGVEYPAVQAEAWHRRGAVRVTLADYAAAEADLVEAFHRASQIGHDELVVLVAADLAEVTRERSAFTEAWGWSRHGHDALYRLGGDAGQAARLQRIQARIRMAEGHPEAAEPLLQDALTAARAAYGVNHLEVAETELELGACMHRRGRHDDARPHIARAVEALGAEVGTEHPAYADALNRQAGVLVSLHRLGEAQALYEKTLAIALPTFGEGHPTTARALNNLGYLAMVQGDHEQAAERFDRALAALSKIHGSDAPQLVIVLTNLAEVAKDRGRVEEAIGHYVRAMAIVERKLGSEHPDVGRVCDGLGDLYMSLGRIAEAEPLLLRNAALLDRTREVDDPTRLTAHTAIGRLRALQGRPEEALRIHAEVLAAFERAPPDNPEFLIESLVGVGEGHLALGRPADAVVPLERALTLRERQPETRAHALAARQFALAQALVATNAARARVLAAAAREAYAGDDRRAAELARVDAWLARHR